MKKNNNVNSIVLLAKRPGRTSFSSLFAVKKALGTSKVGHTGTLDSFAQGLLVVCTGSYTRLVSHITAFDKSYKAIIKFGEQTDTLDPLGNICQTSALPTLQTLLTALNKYKGELLQTPPEYSALKINGVRASDLIRSGKKVELQQRQIFVYQNILHQVMFDDGTCIDFRGAKFFDGEGISRDFDKQMLSKKVKYAHVEFSVSKGTYIRCLARDIAIDCNSCAHLVGLLRTRIGSFDLSDACGVDLLEKFDIENVVKKLEGEKACKTDCDEQVVDNTIKSDYRESRGKFEKSGEQDSRSGIKQQCDDHDSQLSLIEEIKNKTYTLTKEVSTLCGFVPLMIKSEFIEHFRNGRPLRKNLFIASEDFYTNLASNKLAVFSSNVDVQVEEKFLGVIEFKDNKLFYDYVVA